MNEDKFNIEMRKFLKKVGIMSQRLIEQAVRDAISNGTLKGNEQVDVSATLEIKLLGIHEPIEGKIALE